ncbi:hypothetical protein [Streptomyces sp. NPDC057695]
MFVAALTTTHPADRLTGAYAVLGRLVDLPEVWSAARSGRS